MCTFFWLFVWKWFSACALKALQGTGVNLLLSAAACPKGWQFICADRLQAAAGGFLYFVLPKTAHPQKTDKTSQCEDKERGGKNHPTAHLSLSISCKSACAVCSGPKNQPPKGYFRTAIGEGCQTNSVCAECQQLYFTREGDERYSSRAIIVTARQSKIVSLKSQSDTLEYW